MGFSDYELYWAEMGCNEQDLAFAMAEQEAEIKREDEEDNK